MVMDRLRTMFREWLGVGGQDTATNRRLDSIEDDLDRLMAHTDYQDDKIRARRIMASAVKADKIKPLSVAEAWATKDPDDHRISLPPVDGKVYKTRNGMTVGPVKRQDGTHVWYAPGFQYGWYRDGTHTTMDPNLDLVGLVEYRAATEGWPEVSDDLGGAVKPKLEVRWSGGKLPLTDGYRTPKELDDLKVRFIGPDVPQIKDDVPDVLTEVPVASCDDPTGAKLKAIISHLDSCKANGSEHAYDRGWNDGLAYANAQLLRAQK